MQRTKLLRISYVELLVAGLVILHPLANSPDLNQRIQTVKSFGFFYGLLAFAAICAVGFLFRNREAQLKITAIDLLLVVFVEWVSLNKFMVHDVYSFSLVYIEFLGFCAFLLTMDIYIVRSDYFSLLSFVLITDSIKESDDVLPQLLHDGECLINKKKFPIHYRETC